MGRADRHHAERDGYFLRDLFGLRIGVRDWRRFSLWRCGEVRLDGKGGSASRGA